MRSQYSAHGQLLKKFDEGDWSPPTQRYSAWGIYLRYLLVIESLSEMSGVKCAFHSVNMPCSSKAQLNSTIGYDYPSVTMKKAIWTCMTSFKYRVHSSTPTMENPWQNIVQPKGDNSKHILWPGDITPNCIPSIFSQANYYGRPNENYLQKDMAMVFE